MADDNELPEEEQPPVDPQPEPQEPTVERYALVEGGVVLNVTLWDGAAAYDLPEGQALVACGEEAVGPGWAWSEEGGFVAPPEPEPGRRLLPKSTVTARLIAADLQGRRAHRPDV